MEVRARERDTVDDDAAFNATPSRREGHFSSVGHGKSRPPGERGTGLKERQSRRKGERTVRFRCRTPPPSIRPSTSPESSPNRRVTSETKRGVLCVLVPKQETLYGARYQTVSKAVIHQINRRVCEKGMKRYNTRGRERETLKRIKISGHEHSFFLLRDIFVLK